MKTLNVLILNLMPTKEDTERQLSTRLSHASYPINITLLTTATYQGSHTSKEHLEKYYKVFDQVKDQYFDGMIITGAPVECLDYEDVLYWNELTTIMEWSKDHVTSTLHICWGAQAGIYYHYGVKKQPLAKKLSGIYANDIYVPEHPLFEGMKSPFYSPHSCYTKITEEDVNAASGVQILAGSKQTDVYIAASEDCRQIFVFGHPEYDLTTLDKEYHRDLNKADLNPEIPANYYPGNDASNRPIFSWFNPSCQFFANWVTNCLAMEPVLASVC